LELCPTAGAVLDERGAVTAWNPAAEALFGHSRTEAIGLPLSEMVSMPPRLAVRLAAWPRLAPEERTELARGVGLLVEAGDRTALAINLSIVEAPDGTVIAWLQTLAEAPSPPLDADVFRVSFERAPEAITILDADLRQRSVNTAGLDMVGLPPGLEHVGQGARYVHPDDQRTLDELVQRRRAGLTVSDEPVRYRVNHSNGTWRWLESLSVDLRDVPEIDGFVVLSRDVTRDEEQRIALEAATARLNELDRARNHLLSAVSHELRTPLAAILSAS
jgi:PAS domain S-box-containing protein